MDLYKVFIALAVQLGSGAPHCRPLTAVKYREMNPGPVSCPSHHTIQSINLLHQMTFPDTPQ